MRGSPGGKPSPQGPRLWLRSGPWAPKSAGRATARAAHDREDRRGPEIEGRHHQVHWYDEEPHGWNRRENRRDAWRRGVTSFDALCWTRGRGLRKGTDRCGDAVGE